VLVPYHVKPVADKPVYVGISGYNELMPSTEVKRHGVAVNSSGNAIEYVCVFCPAYPHCIGYSGELVQHYNGLHFL
jgi:hypothetical protein